MGCDIHSHAERRVGNRWEAIAELHPFAWRSYGMFGFLAGVRNYSAVPPIAEQRGVPDDMSPAVREEYEAWDSDAHSASWLSIDELTKFDYAAAMEDRRYTQQVGPNFWNGGATCEAGQGEQTCYRVFLGEAFFRDLDKLKEAGAERIVFWFDN